MEEVREWKRQLSEELRSARAQGKLTEKLREIERRTEGVARKLKKAKASR